MVCGEVARVCVCVCVHTHAPVCVCVFVRARGSAADEQGDLMPRDPDLA